MKIGQCDSRSWNSMFWQTMSKTGKKHFFLTLMGGEGYAILRNLCAAALLSTKTFAELSTIMKKHVEPTPNVILERYKFKQRRQRDDEDIKVFIEELKRVSTHCSFGENQRNSMRDRFVWGLQAEALQKRLLREKDLTFDKAAEMATAFESASRGAAGIHNNGIGRIADQPAVNYISDNKKTKPGGSRSSWDNRNNNQGETTV
ncbi:uncharacterized protein LOC116433095 isoform X2 [Nomia melanderi]|uniref:uncharacterized protein LOC116433095 isoform X2 n=1 Tax=Nomia melanderi TaxID=2448451 RepID=UPI003FCD6B39